MMKREIFFWVKYNVLTPCNSNASFEDIMEKMYALSDFSQYGHPEICLEESTLVCIWYLANLESLRWV